MIKLIPKQHKLINLKYYITCKHCGKQVPNYRYALRIGHCKEVNKSFVDLLESRKEPVFYEDLIKDEKER